jgi:hypothetical protein
LPEQTPEKRLNFDAFLDKQEKSPSNRKMFEGLHPFFLTLSCCLDVRKRIVLFLASSLFFQSFR